MVKIRNHYVPIKIPKTLADQMDVLIGHFGYRTRAEIAKEGIRMVLRQHPELIACACCGDPVE